MKNNTWKTVLTSTLAVQLAVSFFCPFSVFAAETTKKYELNHQHVVATTDSVEQFNEYQGKTNCFGLSDRSAAIDFEIDLPEGGAYYLQVEYAPLGEKSNDLTLTVALNGEESDADAPAYPLTRVYADDGEITKDSHGNDVNPLKKQRYGWNKEFLYDEMFADSQPALFECKNGVNKIRLNLISGAAAIHTVTLMKPQVVSDYQAYQKKTAGNRQEVPAGYIRKTQAETPLFTSDSNIKATCDTGDYRTEPSAADKLRLNTIGQNTWNQPGQWISWEIEVEHSGYYHLGLRFNQNTAIGMSSQRMLLIDDKLPFQELGNIKFDYDLGWQNKLLGEETPYQFYLTKGKHTIKMVAVTGQTGQLIQEFNKLLRTMNDFYREIIMITGTNPDQYRDYLLDKDIPDYVNKIETIIRSLEQAKTKMLELGFEKGSQTAMLDQIVVQLHSFLDKPDTVPVRASSFADNISSLSAWVYSLVSQPLQLDYLYLTEAGTQMEHSFNIFSEIVYRFKAFLSSFYNDYSNLSEDGVSGESLTVWVNAGREQAQIVKDLAGNYYTPKSGVYVKLSLVQQGLAEAMAAGRNPDIVLHAGMADVINLASRHALIDLSGKDGFDELYSQFHPESFTPYRYDGGVYAVPLEQNFKMMFYRTDILEQLGLEAPNTWDEFYEVSFELQKNNLDVGMPVGTAIVPDNSMFDTLLYQNGGAYFNENQTATQFDTKIAQKAFQQWTSFYTLYGFPTEFNFYNRFRSGEMPLGIQPYNMYNMLSVAAPEIKGMWEMIPIPATVQTNGTLNRAVSGDGTSAILFSNTKKKEAGFDFIKWYCSAETQTLFGQDIENVLGPSARYAAANTDALEGLNWTSEQVALLKSQLDSLVMTPQIPSSYYVNRSLTYAFRSCVIDNKTPSDALYKYNQEINAEITRKWAEMGVKK